MHRIPNEFLFDRSLDELLEEFERQDAQHQLRRENPYVKDLIEVLQKKAPKGTSRQNVLRLMESNRKKRGQEIPEKFEQAVQSSYNRFCVDSDVYKKRGAPEDEGLFYSPGGKGSGQWAVNLERAAAWLKANIYQHQIL